MGIFFVYILKSSFSLALFYLFYRLLLNNDTFHRFNRVMLLILIIISSLLPLINTTVTHPTQINQSFMTLEDILMMQSMAVVNNDGALSSPRFTWYEIVVMIYWIGLIFFMLRNVWSIIKIVQLIKSGRTVEDKDGVKIIVHNKNTPPFSWLKYILISEKDFNENCADILIHEKAHISRRHSYDIIFADISIFIQWFNPAAWLIKNELKNIHEYEADDMVLKSGVNAKEYQLLLIKKAVGPKLYSIANNFNHSSLKKRITMMLKKKSNPWARMKYIYVLPVAAIAVTTFARPEVNVELNRLSEVEISEVSSVVKGSIALPEQTFNTVKINEETTVGNIKDEDNKPRTISVRVVDDKEKPIYGASVIIEGTSKGTLTDKNGLFTIPANIGEVLCVSFVGKETLRFPIKKGMSILNGKMSLMMFDKIEKVNEVVVVGYDSEERIKINNDKAVDLTSNKKASDDPVFMVVEEMPEYPGGMKKCLEFLMKNVKYPANARKAGVEGRVIVQYVVDKDGSISNPFIVRSISPELDAEALRVIKLMPKWKPGKQRGVNVPVKYTLPITFKLTPLEKKLGNTEAQNNNNDNLSEGSSEDKRPLAIVDGQVYDVDKLNQIDSNKIESVSVIKDDGKNEYIAKYGDKAKNGVIVVKLKN